MPFSQSFTGKDLTAKFPTEGIQKAQQNLSDIIQRVAEIKYKTREERRKEFMEMANIDPVFVLSDMARAEQTKQINLFNNEWGKKLQESGGELSDQDLMNMQSHKNLIITNAQNSLAENKRYEQMRALVQAHPEEYDLEEFKLAETQMMLDKDGKFPLMLPPIKSISPTGAIANYADKWGGVGAAQGVTYGNKTGISTQPFNPKDPNSVYTFFKSLYPKLSYQEQLGMVKDWNAKAPKEEYLKRVDENNDGVYDENEKQNAVILWASENKEYIDAALAAGRKLINVTNVKSGKTTTGTVEPVEVAGAQVKIFPGKRAINRTYGDQQYSAKSFGFGGNTMLYGIPTKGGKILQGDWSEDDVAKGSANARLVLYDPIKHVFVIELGTGSESADMASRVLLEIPETNIQDYQNIPLQLEDGSKITVAAYGSVKEKGTTTPTKKTGELDNL